MKKLITLIALLATAGIAQVVLVEDWEGVTIADLDPVEDDATGWGGHYIDGWSVAAATDGTEGDVLHLNSKAARGVGAWFSVASLGLTAGTTYQLQFAVRGDSGYDGSGNYAYSVIQNNATSAGGGADVNSGFTFDTVHNVAGGASEILDQVSMASGITADTWRTVTSSNFTFSSGSSHIFIGFSAEPTGKGKQIEIGDVSIVSEPATTVGVLGLGALVSLLVCRTRA